MSVESQVLTQFFEAINRFDVAAVTVLLHPEVVRVEPEGFPTAGTYRGIDDVKAHIVKGRGSWAEGSCDPEAFHENGDKVVVFLHAWVRLQDATDWTGGRFADGFVLREGKVVEYHSFAERVDALRWAGIEA